MLKYIRIILVTFFSLALLAAVGLYYYEATHTDSTPPVFQAATDLLEVSVTDPQEVLLEGLTAYDNVDGNVTGKIRVKSISSLINETDVRVDYIVFDEAANHAVYSRTVRYVDYVPPRFTLNRPMIFRMGETVNFRDSVKVTDLRDGDISNKLKLEETTVVNTTPGFYSATLSCTNNMGDTVYLPLSIQITDNSVSRPQITLTDYLIYVEQGSKVQFRKYLKRVTDPLRDPDQVISPSLVIVNSSNVDVDTPGVYEVYYYFTGASGEIAYVILTVIVE